MNANPEVELDLTHYLDVILRRRWIILAILLIVFISVTLYTYTVRPVYQAGALLDIEKERNSGGTIYANGTLIESSNDDYYQTQYKLLQSESLTQKVFDELQLGKEPDFAGRLGLTRFRKAIKIAPIMRSRLVYVRVTSHDPRLAARLANALAQAFVDQNLANQLFISKDVLQTLQLNGDSPHAPQMYESLPAVVNNLLIQSLKGEYARLEAQYAEMSQRFTPKYPAMIALKSNMAALKGQIQAETGKIVQSLKTELSGQLNGNNVRIIDPAQTPDAPIMPRKGLNLAVGLVGGLILGLGVAFLIETIDQTVRTQEDVEEKLQLPYLGMIPVCPLKGKVYESLLAKETSLTGETLRNLRTMIDFAGVSEKSKAMIITSTVQAEGKTYVASNLAVVFAQLGESVLLIDGDLRRSALHKTFGVASERGLSDFLVGGRNVDELPGLLQSLDDVANLKILPCGPRPPNPSELLNTPRLGALVAWAKANFDRVLVDCTPMFPINDTLLWGRHIRPAVFIVRSGETRIQLIRKACQKLQLGGMKILGMAVNLSRPGSLTYSHYGYYYQHYYHHYYDNRHSDKAAEKAS